jgi:hypothetical protein
VAHEVGGGGAPWCAGARTPQRSAHHAHTTHHQVPWKEVSDKWRGARQRWVKSVRGAESAAALAGLMAELHSHLRTDKAAGLFAAGGEWEAALGACAQSEAPNNHVVLAGLWEDMKAGLRVRLVCVCGGRGAAFLVWAGRRPLAPRARC